MIRYIANWLLNPLNHLLLALLIGAIFFWWKKQWGKYCFIYAAGWLFFIAISPVPSWLAGRKEASFDIFSIEKFQIPDSATIHILVLGGGHSVSPSLPPNDQLSPNALARIVEGVRLHRLIPNSKLIGSGFSSTGRIPQARVLTNTAVALGVAPGDTLQIPDPYNTEAESKAYLKRFGSEDPLILVTDAIHMPRAMYWFRQAGCDPIPAPTNHLIKPDPDYSPFPFKPSIRKIEMMDKWLHEWVGMMYAKWKTRD